MKNITLNIDDISDSSEVYESRPHLFFKIFIFILAGVILIALIWAIFFKIDITSKASGYFDKSDKSENVYCEVDGIIKAVKVKDNQYVSKGDVLITLDNTNIKNNYNLAKEQHKDTKDKLEILNAYLSALKGDTSEINKLHDNPYYDEYANRLLLLKSNVNSIYSSSAESSNSINQSINNSNYDINQNNNSLNQLYKLEQSIEDRKNYFDSSDSYYYNVANSYILNYSQKEKEYNNQIELLRSSGASDIEIQSLQNSKQTDLSAIESDNLASIQGQIISLEKENSRLSNSINSTSSGLNYGSANSDAKSLKLQELDNTYKEIESYEKNYKELKANLKTLKRDLKHTKITSPKSGLINLSKDIKVGDIIISGTQMLSVENDSNNNKVTFYIDNNHVGKVEKGMNVKCEFAAFPESDYGIIRGKIVSISNNLKKLDDGTVYYVGEINLDKGNLKDKENKEVQLKDGLACEVRIITEQISVLEYLARKMHLID